METKSITNRQVPNESHGIKTFPIIILVLLILTFVGLQAYYMISSIANP